MENTQSVVGQIKTVEQNLKVVRGAETLSLGQGAEILAGDQLINESGSLVEVSIHGIEGLYSDTLLKMGPNAKAEVSKIDTGLPDFPPKTGIKALTEDVDLYFAEAEVAGSVIEQYEPPVMGLTGTGLLGAGSSLSALGAVGSIAAFGAAFASGGSSEDAASTPVVENPSGEVPKTPTEPNTPTNPKPIPDPNNPVVTDPDPEVPVDPDPETPTDPDEPVDPQPEPDPETPVDPDPNVPVDPPAPEGLDAVLEGIQTQNPDLVQSGLGDLTEGGLPGLDGGAPHLAPSLNWMEFRFLVVQILIQPPFWMALDWIWEPLSLQIQDFLHWMLLRWKVLCLATRCLLNWIQSRSISKIHRPTCPRDLMVKRSKVLVACCLLCLQIRSLQKCS